MRVLVVANEAGSAGKTTTAVTLAALLAEQGQQALVVDFDPQANATAWLGVDPDEVAFSSGDVLLRRATLVEAMVKTSADGVLLVPATPRMNGDLVQLQGVTGPEQRLRTALRAAEEDLRGLDVVIVDCPGAMSLLTVAALVVATSVVTVTAPSGKELGGIPRLETTIQDVADAYNDGLTLGAIVPCIVPPQTAGKLYQDALQVLAESYGDLVTPPVRRSVRAQEAMSHAEPLPLYAPREAVTDDYRAVLAHLERAGVL